eukprot:Nitzschia sp. Nitz4//scaffold88_size82704//10842//12972//NITZ4_005282-RA/size82704-augustus-gene-0.77-mRNA-1//1//CDS//3329559464//2811//frame0
MDAGLKADVAGNSASRIIPFLLLVKCFAFHHLHLSKIQQRLAVLGSMWTSVGVSLGAQTVRRAGLLCSTTAVVSYATATQWRSQCDNGAGLKPFPSLLQPSLLIPTLEAGVRGARLLSTVTMMIIDYEAAKVIPHEYMFGQENKELDALQHELEIREKELDDAQFAYASSSDPSLSEEEKKMVKVQQRDRMHQAASDLADLEQKLQEMGGESSKSRLHRKEANRVLDLCRKNGGVYIKVGQHLANLDYLIPPEYIEVLSTLFDEAPRTNYDAVCQVIEESLHGTVEELFDNFNPTPIASASLAQVHVAYDKKTGKKLAVKVQHQGLRETSVGDVAAVTAVVRFVDKWFDDFTFGWIADELAPHLPKELDFTNEGKNSERAAVNIKGTGLSCVIPKVIWSKTAPRVLTMEFEEGFKATDEEAIQKSGLDKHDIAKLVSSVFNSQVFGSAWVHCDPHPANVLLRNRNGKPEMVLVDHGLYRAIEDDFRVTYALLWRSLMMADLDGIENACKGLGVDEAYPYVASLMTARPYDEIQERSKTGSFTSPSSSPDSQADKAVIRGYAKKYLKEILTLLGQLPPQMLLLLKMNDCLRHIDFALGSPANTLIVAGKYASKAVYQHEQGGAQSVTSRFVSWFGYIRVLLRIQLYDFGIWLQRGWMNKL